MQAHDIAPGEFELNVLFERSGGSSQGIRLSWLNPEQLTLYTNRPVSCNPSDAAHMIIDTSLKLLEDRRKSLEDHLLKWVFEERHYRSITDCLTQGGTVDPRVQYSPLEIAYAQSLERLLSQRSA